MYFLLNDDRLRLWNLNQKCLQKSGITWCRKPFTRQNSTGVLCTGNFLQSTGDFLKCEKSWRLHWTVLKTFEYLWILSHNSLLGPCSPIEFDYVCVRLWMGGTWIMFNSLLLCHRVIFLSQRETLHCIK